MNRWVLSILAVLACWPLAAATAQDSANEEPVIADSTAGATADGARPYPALQVVWRSGIGRGATAAPLAAGERIYVATARQDVKAFDLGGRERWSRKLARGFQAAPRLAERTLVVAAPHPEARAWGLDPRDGATRWETPVGDAAQPPLVGDGVLVFVSLGGWVRALDADSGEERWQTRREGVFPGGALLHAGEVVVLAADGVLHRFGLSRGEPLGTRSVGGPVAPVLLPLPQERGFLVADHSGRVRGFAYDLSPLPVDFATSPLLHPPTTAGELLFVAGTDRTLRAFRLADGRELWSRTLPLPAAGSPVVSEDGGRVALSDLGGGVWTLDAASGAVLSHNDTGRRAAVAAWLGPDLIVATQDGALLRLAGQPTGRTEVSLLP